MPDSDAPSRIDSTRSDSIPDRVNLPAVVPQPAPAREESWLARMMRALFNWKSSTARSDLQTVLANGSIGEGGFSPQERTMLTNILALRGRRVDDVMIPRADIITVQQEIPLGDLIKVFEGAGHSRLVVHNDTLDDPVGMVHIRDVIGYMVRRAQQGAAKSKRKKPFPAGLDLTAYRLVQEGLTNAVKHAQAQHAEVLVSYGDGHVEITVSDDGSGGGDGNGGGHGLVGMRERVSVYGGELDAGPRLEGGYALRARLPVK